MTPDEWLTSTDAAAMLNFVMGNNPLRAECPAAPPSDRKLRLWIEACYLLSGEKNHEVERGLRDGWPNPIADVAAGWARTTDKAQQSVRAALARDIFGNPFRPVRFDRECFTCNGRGEIPIKEPPYVHVMIPRFERCHTCRGQGRMEWDRPGWLDTPTVRALALAAYAERAGSVSDGTLDPHRLSVLADAAEDAGLEDAEILFHLRGGGVHVKGCWVLDALLGKE